MSGRVLDEDERPVAHTLIEVWQANAAGRYLHSQDQHNAPLDPNFTGCGQVLTDAQGRYSLVTIRPGEYPWKNHYNAWRPSAHTFFAVRAGVRHSTGDADVFSGRSVAGARPDFNCVSDANARNRLISVFDWDLTIPDEALGYRFDIVLRGRDASPFENRA